MSRHDHAIGLRRTIVLIALVNFGYFFIESSVAFRQGSVSLFADSVDFLEDTAINCLILLGLTWSVRARARLGMALAGILLVPGAMTLWTAIRKFYHPTVPAAASLGAVGLGALLVNLFCALQLAKIRHHSGSLTRAAFLSARNDVMANLAIICAGLVTLAFSSPWPDFVVGIGIMALNADSAVKVFRVAKAEHLSTFDAPEA
ncbi:MAG: cation transporter [Armatimonadetes bacterium]|nr:cation transporter [Armatimonadota bacterium]MDE2205884.1 cation transporter [Armatimonadota bacterium]